MKIGVISDTHVSSFAELPDRIIQVLNGVDLIVHAGDFVGRGVLDGLRQMGKVKAVQGNMDSDELKRMLPDMETLEIEGRRVGLIHGWGSPHGLDKRVGGMFEDVDIVIYGHSHNAQNEVKTGILFFNPGAARNSYGILTIGREVSGEIVNL